MTATGAAAVGGGTARRRLSPFVAAGTAVLCASILLALSVGPVHVGLGEIIRAAGHRLLGGGVIDAPSTTAQVVLFEIRLPRVLAAALVGAALSSSGAAFQAVFANPLVSPGILGVLAGASFGAALGILLSGDGTTVQALAFAFGLGATLLSLGLARGNAGDRILALVLGGIVSSALFTALVSLLKSVADPYSQLPAIVFWLMGSLANVKNPGLLVGGPPILAAVAGLTLLGRALDILAMGEEEARALGLPVATVRALVIALATMAAALSVALAGIIGWVGLIIPHGVRLLAGPSNRHVMPMAALFGAAFLIGVDTLSRSLLASEIPVGISTALVGLPCLAVLLRRGRPGWRG